MNEPLQQIDYVEYDGTHAVVVHRPVIAETPWVLYVDGRELLTFMCSPVRLHALALGFLLSEGIIGGIEDIWQLKVHLDEDLVHVVFPEAGLNETIASSSCVEAIGTIDVRLRRPMPRQPERRILTSGCGGGITFDDLSGDQPPIDSQVTIPASRLSALMRELNYQATLYRTSRGVHTSALADRDRLLIVAEDVGRHNTLDKLRGECLLQGYDPAGEILLTSGRISSEMITKARKMNVPIVVSRTSPTSTSIRLAQQWNMTLVGYARAPRLRVYTGAQRVLFDSAEKVEAPIMLDAAHTPSG